MSPQAIRFCRSPDGTQLAYAVTGRGPPLVKAPHWLTHLQYECRSPIWKPWIAELSREHTLLRMDERGCGLSDRDVAEFSFDAYVRDLAAVVDAAGFDRPFALFGHSQGGAIAIEYAARFPERVSHLVLLGAYARGVRHRGLGSEGLGEHEALAQLVSAGWGREDDTYRQLFSVQFTPNGTPEQIRAMSELQRESSSAENATRIVRSFYDIDVNASAPRVRCPTLVLHARGDRRVPFEEGRIVAGAIPDARLVPLETDSHVLLPQDPAYGRFFEELRAFLPATGGSSAGPEFASLTPREGQVLERIARGHDNARIATDLGLSEKTVRNNVTRIFDKLGVASRAEAIVLARDRGVGRG
jgi:pimeloyl-ACP methyl ester carboxylesterase/DNA-binding CsgD family transcriptional regulator